ncbi:hypothetical protein CKM354_000204900 [Cercospora kikuchii]|uniref:NACHT domain-containing protein n=1 Tax=Cercospora kikuchii TaxID=84275 RepID=A0A9P3C8I0_9PEZI|nr:uncharacterized protein CKM354_000204900 [Cercospora kikuchii]GIZ38637.1 hypothetical protein CKM354_000204900 [Cercospora kikuchii]
MRLLHVEELRFEEYPVENVPPYAIASHRWGAEEVTLQDIQQNRATSKIGYKKIQGFAKFAQENLKSINWIWIDTCCIDKTSAAELSESVNLMFKWYRNAEICLAYLADVGSVDEPRDCTRSEWFRRGWTLQELLAPRVVVFLTNNWQVIGNKGASLHGSILSADGPGLEASITPVTGLPEDVLHDFDKSKSISRSDKLKWMEGRHTTREEDRSYALYGILGVYLGANYGEGFKGARDRLRAAIQLQADEFRKITTWLDPPDPWTNHENARMGRADQTGNWLLQSSMYQDWKGTTTRLLWVYGKAGCGKTILCSTAIEDIRAYCENQDDVGYATFYCTFSDARKQSLRDMLLSIVSQVCWREPGLAMLQTAYERPDRSTPSTRELEVILLSTLGSYRTVYLMIDGLDECPENNDNQRWVLDFLARLLHRASNIHILVASRDESSIRTSMQASNATQLHVDTHAVDADIRKYVSAEILRDPKLSRLHSDTKAQIEDTLTQRADGMFRWTFCQLQEVKRLKSTKPKLIEQALSALPATLDTTYERMLARIEENVRDDALTLLRWIAYAQRPLTLEELVDTTIIDLTQEASVEIDNRGGLGDALEMLSGLVTTGPPDTRSDRSLNRVDEYDPDTEPIFGREDCLHTTDDVGENKAPKWNTTVRLAHFSVKEYLESTRILQSKAQDFQFQSAREHWILAQSCLAYLLSYSGDARKSSVLGDLRTFPLLLYAAETWYVHLSSQSREVVGREATLLLQDEARHDWWLVHRADDEGCIPFLPAEYAEEASALYYASYLGLWHVAQTFLDVGVDVNAVSGRFRTALIAASAQGHDTIVQMLANAGADFDEKRFTGDALLTAVSLGHEKVVRTLLKAGATVHAADKSSNIPGDLLSRAIHGGSKGVVQMLIAAGANVNPPHLPSPLTFASGLNDVELVRMLLDAGADDLHEALRVADYRVHRNMSQILLQKIADITAQADKLIAAIKSGDLEAAEMLIKVPSNVNAKGSNGDSALGLACYYGHERVVRILLDAGADVDALGSLSMEPHLSYPVNALEIALAAGDYEHGVEIVQMLLASGAILERPIGERLDEALITASGAGSEILVLELMKNGADVNARKVWPMLEDWPSLKTTYNALRLAIAYGHEKIVQLLLAAGANVNDYAIDWKGPRDSVHETAIQLALGLGNENIVQMLRVAMAEGDALLAAVATDGTGRVQEMLDRGANVHFQSSNGAETVLQKAVARGSETLVRMLLDAGAKIDVSGVVWKDTEGKVHDNVLDAALVVDRHRGSRIRYLLLCVKHGFEPYW